MNDRGIFAGMELIGLRSPHLLAAVREAVRAGGGRVTALATHRIEEVADCRAAIDLLAAPDSVDWTVFSSPNAVGALRAVAARLGQQLDPDMPVAGPGPHSAQALAAAGFRNVAAPERGAGIDALLASGVLGELAGRKVALVQRQQGPASSIEAMRQRRAQPVAVECYRRISAGDDLWSGLDAGARAACNCLLAFDGASLAVLLTRAGQDAGRLRRLPLGVHHPQIETRARRLGFENIITQPNQTELLAELAKRIQPDAGN